jgi:hypothetical protein
MHLLFLVHDYSIITYKIQREIVARTALSLKIASGAPSERRCLYIENHWLGQWFKKAYGDEEKTLLESRSSPPTEPRN